MFWGISPCLDLLEEVNITSLEEINILLVGAADMRHILKTLSKRYTKKQVKLNFFVMEVVPEVFAKHLLQLYIALQPVKEFGLIQKTRIFMEIMGNTIIRPISAKYLNNFGRELVKMITNLNYLKEIMPFVNLDLKYKERDYIENVFKFWSANDEFDIYDSWDRRLRKFLGVRYDTRVGAFDWDLHMRLYNIGGNTICSHEYQSFRSNGVAFTWLESEVSKPNRSMVSGIVPLGDKFAHYGYLGDMQTGPFITYGLICDDQEFLKKNNNYNKYRCTDIIERNLREIFHEIEFQNEYEHTKINDFTLGASGLQTATLNVVDVKNITPCVYKEGTKCMKIDNFEVNFITINRLNMMQHKEKFKNFFNIIYYGNSFLKYFYKEVIEYISAAKCLLVIESQLYVVTFRDKDLEEFYKNVQEKTEGLDKFDCGFDFKKDVFIKYILK